ncbi:MAG: hypothetical protein B6I38_09000 [Anaerolineaceae bacterium 4572_5.1]|nr:MAG: hypothetical protein B6I38_09000 [Anaerolineaceae bacterium 4572_5.1]
MSFDENYFSTNTYENVTFAKYSMYWWSNRFYAILARRYGRHGSRLLEIGSGMGHLIGDLESDFETYALDVNHWALAQSRNVAPKTDLYAGSAERLPFADASFGVVIIKHVVEHLRDPELAISELGRIRSKFSPTAFGMCLIFPLSRRCCKNSFSAHSADCRRYSASLSCRCDGGRVLWWWQKGRNQGFGIRHQ